MKQSYLLTIPFLVASSMATAYESTYDRIEWEHRGTDRQYCLDITDELGNIAYGLQAIACGDNLHEFSPRGFVLNLLGTDLPNGFSFFWKVWSPSGYGQAGFEGQVVVGGGCQGLPFASDSQTLQWGCRQQDVHYCVDILDANNNMLHQAVSCADGLHSYSPSQLNLAEGSYHWKVWSPSGYAGHGFEGDFVVGTAHSALAVGSQLYADHCAACHGNNPEQGRSGIHRAVDPMATRHAINGNQGGMAYLSFLSDTELANIAAYVQNPNPINIPSLGLSTPNSVDVSQPVVNATCSDDDHDEDHDRYDDDRDDDDNDCEDDDNDDDYYENDYDD